jgi:hypothetical protein
VVTTQTFPNKALLWDFLKSQRKRMKPAQFHAYVEAASSHYPLAWQEDLARRARR